MGNFIYAAFYFLMIYKYPEIITFSCENQDRGPKWGKRVRKD